MKIIAIILLLILSQEVSYSLSSNKTLPKYCWISFVGTTNCYTPGTHCNSELGLCECDSQYPIPVPKTGYCLDYRSSGQTCLTREQCNLSENSICFGGKQIDSITENQIRLYFRWRDTDPKEYGHCRCKQGYIQMGVHCYLSLIKYSKCSSTHQCTQLFANSHCNVSNRCHCNHGYFYDPDKNQCRLIGTKFSGFCVTHSKCHEWDPNGECRHFQCFCKTDYAYDLNTERCVKYVVPSESGDCGPGYWYNEAIDECESLHETVGPSKTLIARHFDKLCEVIIIGIFLWIAIMRFSPWFVTEQSQSQTGLTSHSNSSENNVRRRRVGHRSRRLNQLQESLDLLQTIDQQNRIIVTLPQPESNRSYAPSDDTQPPPYKEELPTYEEAMAVISVQKS